MMNDKYLLRGVSASKSEVHDAIKGMDKGLYPNSFCKILPDVLTGDPEYCTVMHADTAGTKTSLAYLYWKETDDISIWQGVAQDSLVMNLDDMACVGLYQDIVLSSTIGRNKSHIPGSVLGEIIGSNKAFTERMRTEGIHLHLAGGETADVGDIVRTIDVGITAFGRMKRDQVVRMNIQEGDCVVGLASYGQASYEASYNSGIASNGLTMARHDTLSKFYADNYPESFDPEIPQEVVFTGSRRLTDIPEGSPNDMDVGQLLLSPTRTFLPVIKAVLDAHAGDINGIIHNTGGGQTKVIKFIDNNIRVVKNNLLPVPFVFDLIQKESGTDMKQMFRVFNMGTRLEFYTSRNTAKQIIAIAGSYGIDADIIGHVESAENREVVVQHKGESHSYFE